MIKKIDSKEYKNQIKHFNNYHFHYSAEHNYYDEVYNKTIRYGYYKGNEAIILLKGTSINVFKKFKILLFTFGPIIQYEKVTQPIFNKFLNDFQKEIQNKRYIFAQFYPVVMDDEKQNTISKLLDNSPILTKSLHKFSWLNGTMILDISNPIEEIKSAFRKDIKYNINRVKREGKLKLIISNKEKQIQDFFKLYEQLEQKKNFNDIAIKYYKQQLKEDKALIFTYYYDNKPVSSILTMKYNEQNTLITYISSSTKLGLKLRAPSSLRWEVIKWAKHQGYSKVDFLSYIKRMESVNKFKMGFRPKILLFPEHAYDLVINSPLYYLFMLKKKYIK